MIAANAGARCEPLSGFFSIKIIPECKSELREGKRGAVRTDRKTDLLLCSICDVGVEPFSLASCACGQRKAASS